MTDKLNITEETYNQLVDVFRSNNIDDVKFWLVTLENTFDLTDQTAINYIDKLHNIANSDGDINYILWQYLILFCKNNNLTIHDWLENELDFDSTIEYFKSDIEYDEYRK